MSTQVGSISLQNAPQSVTPLKAVGNWVHDHPTTAKVLKIAGLILGAGLLASIPFALPMGIGCVAGLAVAGVAATVASLILFASYPSAPIEDLWARLEQKTETQLRGLELLPMADVNHRFGDVYCPRATAVSVGGRYLHANKVGEGVAQRCFVASQAPMEVEYETFWKVIFEKNPTLFDLTTLEDQVQGGVTKYYPDRFDEPKACGALSVRLVGINRRTYTYQIENTETRKVKWINRCHFAEWRDFNAVSLPVLQELVQEVETFSPDPNQLLWVHCRAGVGRTGSLITALVLKEKISRGEINRGNLDNALVDIIVELRKQRGATFLQRKEQLDLVRQYAESLLAR